MIQLPFRRRSHAMHDGAVLLLRHVALELVPLKSLDGAIAALPAASHVSVTCSPVKGIAVTQALTEQLIAAGHIPVPHLAARMVRGPEHARQLAAWCRQAGVGEVLVVGGDAAEPAHYADAVSFIADFLAADPGLRALGVTAYPDGHTLIGNEVLHHALHAKQQLLADAGVDGWASTQMCFDHQRIIAWLRDERARGLTLPVHLGMPGVVDRAKLMTLGARLGVGQSMRYLSKNRATVTRMLMPGGYDPSSLVRAMAPHAEELGITGIHSFTFNAVKETAAWREALLAAVI